MQSAFLSHGTSKNCLTSLLLNANVDNFYILFYTLGKFAAMSIDQLDNKMPLYAINQKVFPIKKKLLFWWFFYHHGERILPRVSWLVSPLRYTVYQIVKQSE
jgi:hypothetical protein